MVGLVSKAVKGKNEKQHDEQTPEMRAPAPMHDPDNQRDVSFNRYDKQLLDRPMFCPPCDFVRP